MHLAVFFVLTWLSIPTIIHACSIFCNPDEVICMDPKIGIGSLCEGFRGCHKKCPPGTTGVHPHGIHFICEFLERIPIACYCY